MTANSPDQTLIGAKEIAASLSGISGRDFSIWQVYALSENQDVPIHSRRLGRRLTARHGDLKTWWGNQFKAKEAAE